ncbi:MAG: alpha/beta hydrolase [Pseudomonadota bacterium]
MADTIVLIHGAWLTPSSWDRFRQRFEASGMTVAAPPWPFLDRPVDTLRRAPDPRLAQLGVKPIVDHYAAIIAAMPRAPIVMGHGFGGLIAQCLADRGLGAAVVSIGAVPPRGVAPAPVAIWNAMPVLTAWNGWNRVLRVTQRGFSSTFGHALTDADKAYAHDKFVVPAPGRPFFQAALGIGPGVDWKNPRRPPILLIAGEKDRIVPPSMVRANYRRHLRSPAPAALYEFAGRSHWLCNEEGWEEVADRALSWAVHHRTPGA